MIEKMKDLLFNLGRTRAIQKRENEDQDESNQK